MYSSNQKTSQLIDKISIENVGGNEKRFYVIVFTYFYIAILSNL
jgi:hypothetical protein